MKRSLHILLLLFVVSAQAQVDLTLPSLRRLHQSTNINPAFIPEYDGSVGLPVFSGMLMNVNVDGFDLNTITSSVNESKRLDLNVLQGKLSDNSNGIRTNIGTDIFHVRFKVRDLAIGISSTFKVQGNMLFSKDFFGLIFNGNLPYKGQTITVDGTDINLIAYTETGLSVAKSIGRWNVGGRVKYLNGFVNVSTENVKLEYTTGANSWDPSRIKMQGSINTNGLIGLVDTINGQKNLDTTFEVSDLTSFQNTGFGFDVGVSYWVTPRLLAHASLIDVGAITWKSKAYNYNLNEVDINYTGFNSYEQASDSVQRDRFIDSLQALVNPTITRNSYTTWLPARFTIGVDYDLSLRDRVGFLFQSQYYRGNYSPAFTLSYTRQAGTNWDLATNYSIFNGSYANIGLGTVVKWGAFQLFFMQDDILFYFFPQTGRNIYLRFGFNLVWGRALNPHPRTRGF